MSHARNAPARPHRIRAVTACIAVTIGVVGLGSVSQASTPDHRAGTGGEQTPCSLLKNKQIKNVLSVDTVSDPLSSSTTINEVCRWSIIGGQSTAPRVLAVEVTTEGAIGDYEAFESRDDFSPVKGVRNALVQVGGVSSTTGEPTYGVNFVALTKDKKATVLVSVYWDSGGPDELAGEESEVVDLGTAALARYQGKKATGGGGSKSDDEPESKDEPASRSGKGVLFEDPLTKPSKAIPAADTELQSVSFSSDGMLLEDADTTDEASAAVNPTFFGNGSDLANVRVDVDVAIGPAARAGVLCRKATPTRYFALLRSDTNSYAIIKYSADGAFTDLSTGAVPLKSKNHVRFECTGPASPQEGEAVTLRLTINGDTVEVTDSTGALPAGTVGLTVVRANTTGAEASATFSDLTVTELKPQSG